MQSAAATGQCAGILARISPMLYGKAGGSLRETGQDITEVQRDSHRSPYRKFMVF